jgi:hypothetical protein
MTDNNILIHRIYLKSIVYIEREMCPWAISIIVLVIRCSTHCLELI